MAYGVGVRGTTSYGDAEVASGAIVNVPALVSDSVLSAPQVKAGVRLFLPTFVSNSVLTAPSVGGGAVVNLPSLVSSSALTSPSIVITTPVNIPAFISGSVLTAPDVRGGARVDDFALVSIGVLTDPAILAFTGQLPTPDVDLSRTNNGQTITLSFSNYDPAFEIDIFRANGTTATYGAKYDTHPANAGSSYVDTVDENENYKYRVVYTRQVKRSKTSETVFSTADLQVV